MKIQGKDSNFFAIWNTEYYIVYYKGKPIRTVWNQRELKSYLQ